MENIATCSVPKPRAGIQGLDAYRVAVEFYRLLRHSTRVAGAATSSISRPAPPSR